MPLYEYKREKCGATFEAITSRFAPVRRAQTREKVIFDA